MNKSLIFHFYLLAFSLSIPSNPSNSLSLYPFPSNPIKYISQVGIRNIRKNIIFKPCLGREELKRVKDAGYGFKTVKFYTFKKGAMKQQPCVFWFFVTSIFSNLEISFFKTGAVFFILFYFHPIQALQDFLSVSNPFSFLSTVN